MAKSVTDQYKKYKKATAADKNADIAASNSYYDSQSANTKALYEGQIDDTDKSYAGQYRENAVQKEINQRAVAENMANLGITNSGLSRTQQTAVQTSAANQKASIDLAKQNQIDSFVREMTSKMSEIEANKVKAAADIVSNYNTQAWNAANNTYGIDVEAETSRYSADKSLEGTKYSSDNSLAGTKYSSDKSLEGTKYSSDNSLAGTKYSSDKSSQTSITVAGMNNSNSGSSGGTSPIISTNGALLSRDYTGTLKDKNVSSYVVTKNNGDKYVKYVDGNSGATTEILWGQNPYTGKVHNDAKTNGEFDEKKVFDNGYQPNNVKGNKLSPAYVKTGDGNAQLATASPYGFTQTVFEENGRFYIWDGKVADYKQFTPEQVEKYGFISKSQVR